MRKSLRDRKRGHSVRALLALGTVAVVFFAAPADLAVAQTGPATPVNIPDTVLRAKLETALGKSSGDTITRADMASFGNTRTPQLDFQRAYADRNDPTKAIKDLTGMEYATRLQFLILSRNEISDLTPLAGATGLQTLTLSNNLIMDLRPLANLPNLRTLVLKDNRITDLTPIAGLTSLRTLEVPNNRITDLMPLARLTSLTDLSLYDNQIRDLMPLARLTSLVNLLLDNNRIMDLTPLRDLTALEYLSLERNPLIKELSPLTGLTRLRRLDLSLNTIEDIGPLVTLVVNSGATFSGGWIDLRDNSDLNTDAVGHVATLQGRGINIVANTPLRLNRTVRGVIVAPGVSTLTVTWEELNYQNSQGYRVFWKSGGQTFARNAGRDSIVIGVGTTAYTIPSLTPGQQYGVSVRTNSPNGSLSHTVYGTPLANLDPVTGVNAEPGVESLDVTWTLVAGAADYRVQWKSGGQEYDPATRQAQAGGDDRTSYTISDLTPGVEYTVRVIATTAVGANGPPSDEATGTPLDTMDSLEVDPDITSLHVTWDPVDGAESYRVQWKSAEQEDYTDARQSPVLMAGTTSYTISDLTPATEYTVRLTATTADAQLSKMRTRTTRLSQVTGLNVEPGEESLDVTWNPVNGADGYKIQWKSGEQDYDPARQAFVRGADTTSYTIPGLTPDIAYTVRVSATATNVPDGVWSKEETGRPSQDRDQQRRVLSLVLAGVGRTLAADAVEILSSRSGTPASRLHVTLDGHILPLTAPPEPAPSPSSASPSPLAGEGRGEGGPAAKPGTGTWQRVTGVALGVARALGVTVDVPTPLAEESRGEGRMLRSNRSLPSRFPAGALRRNARQSPLRLRPVSAKDLLARSAFNLPLTRTGADGLPAWTLWGRGAASGFSGQPQNDFTMTGNLYSGYVGVDYRPKPAVLLGLAVAHSTGGVDYTLTGASQAAVDVEVTSILPYAHWQPTPSLGVWSMLGAGWGNMAVETAVSAGLRRTTDLSSWMGAVGGRQALITWQGIDVAAKTDAFLTTMKSDGRVGLAAARGRAQRVRLLMEGRTAVDLSPVSRVQPRLELGGRWDSGTAEQGLGLELGGGLAYTQTDWGLSVDTQGRYLLVHQDGAFENWGASVNVRLDPGIGGEGAYLTVAPVWGQPGSGVAQLWGNAAAVPGGPTPARAAGWRPANVAVDVGYGLALADGRDLLTPYGGLVLGDPGAARYRLGSRWAVSTLLDLSVEGERAEQPGQAVAHRVSVRLGWQW